MVIASCDDLLSEVLRPTQLKAYQDDFAEERKDRERIHEEKQCSAVKHEAEVTSMKLQLERCRTELAHYTAETNKLYQQLHMKNQQDEEQYKKHLENMVCGVCGVWLIAYSH